MMSAFSAILIAILLALASGLAVAYAYEKKNGELQRRSAENLENEIRKLTREVMDCRLSIARDDGIGIGRQCDTIQQQMIRNLKNGSRFSVCAGSNSEVN